MIEGVKISDFDLAALQQWRLKLKTEQFFLLTVHKAKK